MKNRSACLILLFLFLAGCGQSSSHTATKFISADEVGTHWAKPIAGSERVGMGGRGPENEALAGGKLPDNRKIIYSADLSIVVEDFDPVESAVASLVKKHDGLIADSTINTQNRERRKGEWKIRVPVAKFDAFLGEAGSIGIPVSRSRNAQDVTEEYVDVEARITNKKKLEARILELLERPDDKIQHVIEVEKELGRVREEIERMEGRIRYLKDKVDLTTVNLSIAEEKEYRAPEAPTFSNRVKSAWANSVTRIKDGFEDAVVWSVANAFAILVALVIGFFVIGWIRSNFRKWYAARSN